MAGATGSMTVDTKGFARQVDGLARKHGLTGKVVMEDQQRLWVVDLIRRFPPKKGKQGKDAVQRDMEKLFFPMDTTGALRFMQQEFERAFPTAMPRIFNLSGSQSVMKGLHKRFRRRDGRVNYQARQVGKIGDSPVYNKMHVTKRAFNAHARPHKKKVGQLKAGWMPAAIAFRARAPAFVTKQASRRGSSSGRGTMKANGDGFLEAVNSVPYAGRHLGIVQFTGRVRQRDLDFHLEKRIGKLIDAENRRAA